MKVLAPFSRTGLRLAQVQAGFCPLSNAAPRALDSRQAVGVLTDVNGDPSQSLDAC